MREILIFFLTKKGEAAYKKIDEAGSKETGINKRIVKRIYHDVMMSAEPLVVKVIIKIPRLAVATELDKQIIKALEGAGAVNGIDFRLEIKYGGVS